jgi:hypothetical protein
LRISTSPRKRGEVKSGVYMHRLWCKSPFMV